MKVYKNMMSETIKLLCSFLAISMFLAGCSNSNGLAYVNIERVFDQFSMKKELLQEFESVKVKRTAITDSLRMDLKNLYNQFPDMNNKKEKEEAVLRFKRKEQYYYETVDSYEKMNSELMSQYDEQILKRMNSFIQDYGKENGYEFIFGTSGSGNVMYANAQKDITDEVIEYINKKYEDE